MKTIFQHSLATGLLFMAISSRNAVPIALAQDGATASTLNNIALHRPVTFSAEPNYGLSNDPEDALQITDGKYTVSEGAIWGSKSTVGWAVASPLIITIDLGQVQPIGGLSLSTAAGASGVVFPYSIYLAVSDDKVNWRYVGDLVPLSRKNGVPPAAGYATHRYITHDLATRGRYVSVGLMTSGSYTFCDEIEVYRGMDASLNGQPTGEPIADLRKFIQENNVRLTLQRRLNNDIRDIATAVTASTLSASAKQDLQGRLERASKATAQLPAPNPKTFTTVFPINSVHADILATFGEVLRSRGLPALTAWKRHRYAPLQLLEAPTAGTEAGATVDLAMLGGETRADSFLLTNSTEKAIPVAMRVNGLPGGARPDWLRVASVPWTDTQLNIPVADALPDAPYKDGAYRLSIPAGLTCKVWLTVDSTKLQPGRKTGELLLEGGNQKLTVPFNLHVATTRMGRPRLSLGMWDYTAGQGAYAITPRNRAAAIKLMRSHGVDTPWAQLDALPVPKASDFGPDNQLKRPLNFKTFDEWVKMWPNARQYFVFVNAQATPDFAGAKMGTPEFNSRVGAWVKALSQHMRTLNLRPEQLGLLLVDEPHTPEQEAIAVPWIKAVNAAAPEITLFQDPAWDRPDQVKEQYSITGADIICPTVYALKTGGADIAKYYADRRAAGQKLWVYQCSGPTRLFDPQLYYRLQAWHAFHNGAVGSGFWAFGDNGGGTSSWNDYAAKGAVFTPAFLDEKGATDSIHWQAVREGVEDYEYLSMLRDKAAASTDTGYKERANALINEATTALWNQYTINFDWYQPTKPEQIDDYRLRILAMLEESAASH